MAMAWEMKPCRKTRKLLSDDRLTSLPDEAFDHILSMLPTKDVAVLQLVSTRLLHVFSSITSIDLDAFSTCPSRDCPILVDHFPKFRSFVSKVLLQPVDRLTRFRLRFGGDKTTFVWYKVKGHRHSTECIPNVEPGRLNVWLSYPLAHSGLRDLELTFRLRNYDECKLPPKLFDFPSLESFRVDANIEINNADIPLICLPKLKLMHIHSVYFTEGDFVTRLVSSSPALEDLCISQCIWEKIDRMTIASHSLQRMDFVLRKRAEDGGLVAYESTKLVTFDTPNLQYLCLGGQLADLYSITHMNVLVEANLNLDDHYFDCVEASVWSQLSLMSAITDVQQLYLTEHVVKALFKVAKLQQQLPMFCSLKTIMLDPGEAGVWRWDIVLLLILHSSPLLETLVFPKGIMINFGESVEVSPGSEKKEAYLEDEGLRTNTLPCLTHLNRFEIGLSFALDRELNMINFFLGKAPGLKEVVVCLYKRDNALYDRHLKPKLEKFTRKLGKLQRDFNSCSFIVR